MEIFDRTVQIFVHQVWNLQVQKNARSYVDKLIHPASAPPAEHMAPVGFYRFPQKLFAIATGKFFRYEI